MRPCGPLAHQGTSKPARNKGQSVSCPKLSRHGSYLAGFPCHGVEDKIAVMASKQAHLFLQWEQLFELCSRAEIRFSAIRRFRLNFL